MEDRRPTLHGVRDIDNGHIKGTKRLPFCVDFSKRWDYIPCAIATVGDHGVGKTSCLYAILNGCQGLSANFAQVSTVGLDVQSVNHPIDEARQKAIRITFWDTAGQERYNSLVTNYVKRCHIVFVVFDVQYELGRSELTNHSLQNAAGTWLDLAEESIDVARPKIIMLVASKCEGPGFTEQFRSEIRNRFRQLRRAHIESKKNERIPIPYIDDDQFFFTSAATGEGVEDLMVAALERFKKVYAENVRSLLSPGVVRPATTQSSRPAPTPDSCIC